MAAALGRLSDKAMAAADRMRLLAETRDKEFETIGKVAALAPLLRSAQKKDRLAKASTVLAIAPPSALSVMEGMESWVR